MTIIRETRHPFIDRGLWCAIVMSIVGLIGYGCAAPNVRKEGLSAEEHREQAEKERAIAAAHRQWPAGEESERPPRNEAAGLPTVQGAANDPNDTNWHLLEAARHGYHARQHEAAAAALEQFENAECRALPYGVRDACPLLVLVSDVQKIEGGVRIHFAPDANVDQIVTLMRCHLAYARARGFDRVAACPLYVRGVDIQRTRDGRSIDVTGDTLATVTEIRQRIHELVAVTR